MKISVLFLCYLAVFVAADHGGGSGSSIVYDFIVVGSGPGGATIATRLSENPNWRVLVLEKGKNVTCTACDTTTGTPGATDPVNQGLVGTHDPNIFSTSQSAFLSRNVQEQRYEGPGGKSRINGMAVLPASDVVLNRYYPTGFHYNDMKPYYKKLQNHFCNYLSPDVTGIPPAECADIHGNQVGPMDVSPPDYSVITEIEHDFVNQAINTFGYGFSDDYQNMNNRSNKIAWYQYFKKRANLTDLHSARSRESSWTGYLKPALDAHRPNLVLNDAAWVTRILFDEAYDGDSPKARGVEYWSGGSLHVVYARKEVIISAGAIRSPQLLKLSGVGPAAELQSLGIEVVANISQIGANYHTHPFLSLSFSTNTMPAIPAINDRQSFLLLPISGQGIDPDTDDFYIKSSLGAAVSSASGGIDGPDPATFTNGANIFSVLIIHSRPAARGSVTLLSSNPFHNPAVDYGWTTNQLGATANTTDTRSWDWAINKVRQMVTTGPFGTKWITGELWPGTRLGGNAFLHRAYGTYSTWHDVGTVALGQATDLRARVKGVQGLRVCDGSLLPTAPNGNPSFTIFAMCEKIADLIKQDYGYDT